ncbi:Spy/CpxP family protein refolding chaperone [Azohydromonas caseinilytica]|uniref:Spy/CpxP family protein refolding chaperone n=1 Tax=Azohydromonas caseinilytica TaxID=2728836 RepID=A0A848FIC6_9BURK|nr:Spy/CpxP family protein refolding chaperone [Azohydromonas caseinilytica]NML18003.1 Spy/CpxP family protein refolding chaperone [Azohydromonas caseinilytica]
MTTKPELAMPSATARRSPLRRRAAAALLALGTLSGIALAQTTPPAAPSAPPPGMHMHGGPMHGGPMHGRHLERMLDRVDATAEQRTKIRAILDAAKAEMRTQAPARQQLREQGLALLAQPTIDTQAVEQLRQQMLAQHDQASQRWTRTLLEVANVLTPQQRAQLAEQMRQRAARGGERGGHPR